MADVTIRFEDAADVHIVLLALQRLPEAKAAVERNMEERGIVGRNLVDNATATIADGIAESLSPAT